MCNAHRDYFNGLASTWRKKMPDEPVFGSLLDRFGIRNGDFVLDAGAGTGRMTVHLAQRVGSQGRVVAQDFAWQMLSEGASAFCHPNVHWLCNDLHTMSVTSGLFDCVLCFSVFPHLKDPEKAIQEIHRILKPGGRVLILHISGSQNLNAFHATLKGVVKNDRLMPADAMAGLMVREGFRVIRAEENEDLYWVEGESLNV